MKKINLFGYANTTKAIAKHFKEVNFYDDKIKKVFKNEYNHNIFPAKYFKDDKKTFCIPSPGIPPYNPLIKKASKLISEYDLIKDVPFSIWISGTNGKTTVSSMIEHLLKDKGAISGGNIGKAIFDLDKNVNIWVLELSSFSLYYTKKARPNIYILLNVEEDHLNWHKSFKNYEEAKLKTLKRLKDGEVCIIPKKYKNYPSKGYKITYENAKDLADFFKIKSEKINFKGSFLTNALIALGIEKILFDSISYNKINKFKLLNHRQEEFKDKKNRLWVNDSKATNVGACLEAIKRYKNLKLYIILGGNDKDANMEAIFKALKGLNIEIFCIGSNKEKLKVLSNKYKYKYQICTNLEDAVNKIDKSLDKKSCALLSPATSSLDEFSSYEERGNLFKKFVYNLRK